MKKINETEITREMLTKAMACETPQELVKLAQEAGIEMTEKEAGAYLSELSDYDLDSKELKDVAGGAYCAWVECGKKEAACKGFRNKP